ncbi:hypothetical protein [Halogranum rubrum]|uniref:Uncharacterized protein n=1 Tax=Halogranum salarium B-1 TaxID=1210908 RepID=J2ZVN9_9EURY|nr:hypothetical protein [Halogranum salarium]EJN57098.1 hypothetical protein HSB1_44840 [Halogranum salarium B-1]
MTTSQSRTVSPTVRLLGTGLLAATALLGGVFVGGWLAFQTPYWRAFKALVEGLPLLSGLHLGILLLLVGIVGKTALQTLVTER